VEQDHKKMTTKTMAEKPKDKYEFNESEHIHTLNGKPLMGVTTVLSVISKPALVPWAAKTVVDYIIEKAEFEGLEPAHYKVSEELLQEAKSAHRVKKETAGDWGTGVHKSIEEWIKEKKLPELDFEGLKGFLKFIFWAEKEEVKFLESEKHIYSKELWVGGIVDLVIEIKGKKYIADIKTSSGIYNEAFFQMAAYDLCLKEMGEGKDIAGYIVINLKKDGTMDIKMATDMEMNQQAFKSALSLYKIINNLKK
jgi:CRISPR/Cas system-associated exonuclease Cas4 (RecB family)